MLLCTDMNDLIFNYSNTDVLVTGGTSGIGKAIAELYCQVGANVIITGRKPSSADYGNDLKKFKYLQLDLENKEHIHNLKQIKQLDILVNNAGLAFPDGKSEDDPDIFDRAVNIHLNSFFRISTLLQPKLTASNLKGGASIIGIASMTSFFGMPLVPGYGAGKGGLVQLIKTLSMKWASENIRVNAIAAGFIKTRMTEPVTSDKETLDPILERIPLRKIGDPNEIANAALFITSPQASYITGETLKVDGGYSIST